MDAFLFTGCSHVVETGEGGGGWIAVRGTGIAFGNGTWSDLATVSEAESAAAVAGVHGAAAAFPGTARLLVSSDANEVQFAPWGDLAEGMDASLDPTGLLGACQGHGIDHSVRWWPGHRPGPFASDILLLAARALAIQARRGNPIHGRVPLDADWRSSLVAAIGRSSLNHAVKDAGLTMQEAAAVTGLDEGSVETLVMAGRLRKAPHGGLTLSSVLEIRDGLVREGIVSWPPDDFGAAHLAELGRPATMRLFVGAHQYGSGVGIAIARRWRDEVKVASERFKLRSGHEPFKALMARTLEVLARRIGDFETPGPFDVVTTLPWLATLLTDLTPPSAAVAVPLAKLWENAAARGVSIRPRLVKDARLRLWRGNESLGLLATALAAARISSLDAPFNARSTALAGGDDALLPRAESLAAAHADRLTQSGQAAVSEELFRLVPGEVEARARFEALATEVHASYRGGGLVLRPILPGPVEGRVGVASEAGAMACSPYFAIDDALAARWRAWWRDYAVMLSRHPVLALREAVLRLDGELDVSHWSKLRLRSVEMWIAGTGGCHFRVRPDRLKPAQAEMRALVAACGGWPFAASRGSAAPARPALAESAVAA